MTATAEEGEDGTNEEVFARVHCAAVADPTLQLIVTGNANPAIGVTVAVVVLGSPATTLSEVGLRISVKSTPLPLKVAVSPLYSRLVEFTPSVPFC